MPASQGDIAFVAFSEGNNGNGGFAFVTLAPIAAGSTITFTDQNWSGTAFSGAAAEGSLLWTAPVGGVAAGTLIQIVTSAGPTANIGTPAQTGNPIVLTFNDGIYAISGTVAAPATFITAVTTSAASIAGTGLTYGTDALNLGTFANAGAFNQLDVGCINTATVGTTFATPALAAAAYNTATNWIFDANNASGTNATPPNWPALSDALSPLNGKTTLPVCFLAGTMIGTPTGETAVDKLQIGDLVTTADGRSLPVKFIGRQTMSMLFADHDKTQPVLIKAGALAYNAPHRDLYVSPGHAMLVDGVLVIAAALVNGTSILRWQDTPAVFTYFHVELDEHAVIFAEGSATETYCDNVPREVFDNAAAYKALYPNAKPIVQLDLPTVKSARQMPLALRVALHTRALAIGAQRDFAVAA